MENEYDNIVRLTKALKIEPGGVYAIECDRELEVQVAKRLRSDLDREEERLGAKFIFLPKGLTVKRDTEPQS